MEQVLLISHCTEIYEITAKITQGRYKLIWCTYKRLEEIDYSAANIIIMHFDSKMLKQGTFELIIKVRGRTEHEVPILALLDGGTIQDVFSMLNSGVYDYLDSADSLDKYKKKIDDTILWNWYMKKYGFNIYSD